MSCALHKATALVCALVLLPETLAACTGTEGDLLRTRPETSDPGDPATPRPRPNSLSSWQIQLSGSLDTTLDVELYTADLETPVAAIQALHQAKRIVICYFSAGTREPFRDDAALFPASSVGAPLVDYPNERWLDIRDATVRSIMRERVARAAEIGCDGLHPSGLGAFQEDTELDLSRADQLAYNRWLASEAHGLGLSIGLVEGDTEARQELVADFDWTVVWSCVESGCLAAAPFLTAAKPAFVIEYGDAARAAELCPRAQELGLSAVIKRNADLDAYRAGCP
ncbi:MAG TPA: endo alpha-1,4 polygalactosaminidase [Polyangiaceae bacterium]|nr:endo alpha-1,4 polygalactosaminidase [Polyangiaceae bacterium]